MKVIKSIVSPLVLFLSFLSCICVVTGYDSTQISSYEPAQQSQAAEPLPATYAPLQQSQAAEPLPASYVPIPNRNISRYTPVCHQGYHLENGQCVPDQPVACLQGYHLENGQCVPDYGPNKTISCVSSGGTVKTRMCCGSTGDFPNTCLIGACGCSPENSKETKVCDCGPGKCFDGTSCVDISTDDNGECNAGVLIQGQIVSISNPCRDFQNGSACSFKVRIDKVLKGNFLNVVSGETIAIHYTSGRKKLDAQVGDCIEVCANWDTDLYCGDNIGYIKKIACFSPCNADTIIQGEVISNPTGTATSSICFVDVSINKIIKPLNAGPLVIGAKITIHSSYAKISSLKIGDCIEAAGQLMGGLWVLDSNQCHYIKPIACEPCIDNQNLHDKLDHYDSSIWTKDNACCTPDDPNALPAFNRDCSDHISFPGYKWMEIYLDNTACSIESTDCSNKCNLFPYYSGLYRTNCKYGYGRYEVSMIAAKGPGLITGFFPYDGDRAEIDVEILGKDPTKMEVNYWNNGQRRSPSAPPISLGFDASEGFHKYGIDWAKDSITWFVDDYPVWTDKVSQSGEIKGSDYSGREKESSTPLPTPPAHIYLNLWASRSEEWAGKFEYTGSPLNAKFRDISFTPD